MDRIYKGFTKLDYTVSIKIYHIIKKDKMKTLSILGAGWLGLELAQTLKAKFYIKLSARNELTRRRHIDLGFESFILTEGVYDNLDMLLSCEYLLINYPPSKFNNYLQFITTLSQYPTFSQIEKVLFVSSSSVYPKKPDVYGEDCSILVSSNPLYYKVEQYMNKKAHLIFRCAGLMGANRIAGKYFSNKIVTDGKSRVNHVHRIDVIRAFSFAIKHDLEGIFNVCAPQHPTKEELCLYQSKHCHFPPPIFIEDTKCTQRIIDSSKLERLGFEYERKNPIEFIG